MSFLKAVNFIEIVTGGGEFRTSILARFEQLGFQLSPSSQEHGKLGYPIQETLCNGHVKIVLNNAPDNQAQYFSKHGCAVSGIGFGVSPEDIPVMQTKFASQNVIPTENGFNFVDSTTNLTFYFEPETTSRGNLSDNNSALTGFDHIVIGFANSQSKEKVIKLFHDVMGLKLEDFFIGKTSVKIAKNETGTVRIALSTSEGSDLIQLIKNNRGPAVDHVAFATNNLLSTTIKAMACGVTFFPPENPVDYYNKLRANEFIIGRLDVSAAEAGSVRIVPFDRTHPEGTYFLQTFMEPFLPPYCDLISKRETAPQFFIEHAQRLGGETATTFPIINQQTSEFFEKQR